MFELSKETAVKEVLQKRFGKTDPGVIEELYEVNIWYSTDEEINELGICIELKLEDGTSENYQVNKQGIIFSWGKSPIIDERSQKVQLNLEKVYDTLPEKEEI